MTLLEAGQSPQKPHDSYRHEALLYRGDDEFVAGTVPFIREGLQAGQPVMVAGNGHGIYYMMPAAQRAQRFLPFAAVWTKGRKFCGADLWARSTCPTRSRA